MHFQSILLWRQAQVPTSIHLSRQYSRALHISMFGPRLFHMDNRHHSRHPWQHPQQLICLGQVLHVRKGPPAEYMPSPPEVMSMSTGASAVVQEPCVTEEWQDPQGQIRDRHVDWKLVLSMSNLNLLSREVLDQLHHRQNCVCFDRRFPKLTKHLFDGLFPADNVITAVQKNHGVHKIHMSEVATWVLNATHWFSLSRSAYDGHCMVPQLGRCKQVPVLDADIAGSLW